MKASLIFDMDFTVSLGGQKKLDIRMDLYKIDENEKPSDYPEGYKFSWIAFNPDDPSEKVLVDCHKGKGPHFHIDNDIQGTSFQWNNLDEAIDLFTEKVSERFGVDIKTVLNGDEL